MEASHLYTRVPIGVILMCSGAHCVLWALKSPMTIGSPSVQKYLPGSFLILWFHLNPMDAHMSHLDAHGMGSVVGYCEVP